MNRFTALSTAVTAIAFSAILSGQASANLIVNGDFEAGNTGFTSGYIYSPGNINPAGVYDFVTSPYPEHNSAATYGDHTTGSGLMMAVNGGPDANTPIWSETINVLSGATYDFAAYISSWTGQSPAVLSFAINGDVIGNLNASSTTGVWDLAFATWLSDSTSATISILNANTAFSGNDFALDDIYFGDPVFSDPNGSNDVPEPAILGLFGLGLAATALATRRRKIA